MDKFHYYEKPLRASLKILAILYYYLLLIIVIDAGLLYVCLKIEGYLITFMHTCFMKCYKIFYVFLLLIWNYL